MATQRQVRRDADGELRERGLLTRRHLVGEGREAQYPRAKEAGPLEERAKLAQTDPPALTGAAEAASSTSRLRRLDASLKISGDMCVPSLCSKY
ncbi:MULTISPECIES: hypothetical protein [unclassified Streptomyces]|uniref:hypothetical protein n=1 Tax=unclassified Streptomyces TaxID=2593676 RepID=UPI002365905C|nr:MULTISPECIES: hypothetical protein [unclassified Streptomyces]MDF3143441.1 hypothetical protein [Streptomyces sp. T21Q-yed]WDF41260.1 hypothetical protein PBV52_32970 [Streptomyces sp. T12]